MPPPFSDRSGIVTNQRSDSEESAEFSESHEGFLLPSLCFGYQRSEPANVLMKGLGVGCQIVINETKLTGSQLQQLQYLQHLPLPKLLPVLPSAFGFQLNDNSDIDDCDDISD